VPVDYIFMSSLKEVYEKNKIALLRDQTICKPNRDLFKQFFEYQERKLKRMNGLPQLDDGCYRTLYGYVLKFKNVNKWFKNKDWKKLTKEDIRKVYDALEDGKIKTNKGTPFKDRNSYYNKIFKSKPFQLAQKGDLAREVIEYYNKNKEEVRFITKESFEKLVSVVNPINQKLLLWLAFDIGENITSLLKLQKKDCVKQKNPDTKDYEYIVNLSDGKLKRSRIERSEITNFKETTSFLDIFLKDLNENDNLFHYGYGNAKKFLTRAVEKTGVKTIPTGKKVTWKDLRSSMACYLLKNDWSIDEVKRRLGHKPSSYVIDKYVNYLAIDRHKPKKKIYQNNLQKVVDELEDVKKREQLSSRRIERLQDENNLILEAIKKRNRDDAELNPEFVKVINQLKKEMDRQKNILETLKIKKK
jgi:hypothetical protein